MIACVEVFMNFKTAVISSLFLINATVFAQDITLEGTQTHVVHDQGNKTIQKSSEKTRVC